MPGMEVEEWPNMVGIFDIATDGKGLNSPFSDICGVIFKETISGGFNSYGAIG